MACWGYGCVASIRKEIHTSEYGTCFATSGRCIPRLLPGFVVDTPLEPDESIVTLGNGVGIREPIIDVNDEMRRVPCSAIGGQLTHYNASAQVFVNAKKQTTSVWIADRLTNEAACPDPSHDGPRHGHHEGNA